MGLDSTAKRIRNPISKHYEIFTIPKKKGACKYDDNIIIPAIVNNRTKYEIEITVFRKKIKDNKYNVYIKFQISKSDKNRLDNILGDINKHIIEKLEKYKENICYIEITIPSDDDIYENFIDILATFYKDEDIKRDDDNILKIDEKEMNIENSQNIKSDNPFGYKYLEEYDQHIFSKKLEIRDTGMTKKYEEIIDTEKYVPDRNGMSPEDKVIKFQYAIYKIFNVKQSSIDKPETNQDIVTNMAKIPFRHIDQLSTPKPEIRRLASGNQETSEIRLLTSGSQDTTTVTENNQNLPAKKDEKIGTSNLQDIFYKKGIKKLDFTKKE